MIQERRLRRWTAIGAALVALTAGFVLAVGSAWKASAASGVTAVTGSAFGAEAINLSLLGGTPQTIATTPAAAEALLSDASNSPQSVTVTSGSVSEGPATLFTSDGITVQSSGSLGTSGSETSSSSIANINHPTASGNDGEILSATQLTGSCSTSATGPSGSTSITGGTLQTDNTVSPPVVQTLPANPTANTMITGVLRPFTNQTDHFVVVLNEQKTNADGSLTVNPVDEYLGYQLVNGQLVADPAWPATGSSAAQGNIVMGQVVCGVTAPPVANDDSYTTPFNTTLNVAAPGVLSNDTDAQGFTLTAALQHNPSDFAAMVFHSDGSFTYTPVSTFSGMDSFTYVARDGHGGTSNVATVTITVGQPVRADLSVGITHSPDPAPAGGSETFTITVSNLGPDAAPHVIDDATVLGGKVVSARASNGRTCVLPKAKVEDISCSLGSVPTGPPVTVTVTVKAPHKDGISISSTVSSPADITPGNDTATDSVTVAK